MKVITFIYGTAVVLGLGMNVACAESATEAPVVVAETPELVTPEPVRKAKKPTPEVSEGMRIPLDGSSLDAFNKSLEFIQTKTSAADFESLKGAIGYLEVYDLSARRDKEKLAKNLDGLTGEEIVQKVKWRSNPKKSR